jgi:hypothetical protein
VPIIRPANLDEAGVLFDKATLVFLSEQAELADQRTTTLGLQPVMTFRGDTEAEALTTSRSSEAGTGTSMTATGAGTSSRSSWRPEP